MTFMIKLILFPEETNTYNKCVFNNKGNLI